jgi:hypothetical protein
MPSFGAENVSEIGLCMTGGAFAVVSKDETLPM